MESRKKIAEIIENKLSYTNGWRITDEDYENECLMIADELIKLFSLHSVIVTKVTLPFEIENAYKRWQKEKFNAL